MGREGGHDLSRAEVEIRLVRVERGEEGGAGLPVEFHLTICFFVVIALSVFSFYLIC